MTTIKDLERTFQTVNSASALPREQHEFSQRLLESNDPAIIEFHYGLLRRRDNPILPGLLREAFSQRGPEGEKFLLQKIEQEKNPELLADIVLILGLMQSEAARGYALQRLRSTHPEVRHVATYVLGWVGTADDLSLLGQRLLEDPIAEIRRHAATAHYQVVSRIPEAKDQAVQNLKRGLMQEQEESVLVGVLISLQDILKKRFGLRENIEEREITGDVRKAKEKALRFLTTTKP